MSIREPQESEDEYQQVVEKLVQILAESSRSKQEMYDRQCELVQSADQLKHRLIESRKREQRLDARVLELTESKDELEGKLAESNRREQVLNDCYRELQQRKEELEQRARKQQEQQKTENIGDYDALSPLILTWLLWIKLISSTFQSLSLVWHKMIKVQLVKHLQNIKRALLSDGLISSIISSTKKDHFCA